MHIFLLSSYIAESHQPAGTETQAVFFHIRVCVPAVRQGAPHHYHCDSVNTLVGGRKRWFILPPVHAFYSNKHPVAWIKEHFSPSEVEIFLDHGTEAFHHHWNKKTFRTMLTNRGISDHMGVCDQEAGDMIYMPAFYGHATLNLEESVGIAYEFNRGDC